MSVVADKNGLMSSFIAQHGYVALFFLAIIESACAPIPSEVTFGFAGALCTPLVAQSVGLAHPFSMPVVILIGTVGSLIGSVIAYEVGRTAGRAIVDRWGKWILLTHKDLDAAEGWFAKYGWWSVLVGRVIPVVRSAISVPAGMAEMKRGPFAGLTVLGSAAWVSLLAALGYSAGLNWENVSSVFHKFQAPMIVILAVLIAWFFWHRIRTVRRHLGN